MSKLVIIDKILPDEQYCKEVTKKDTIYIHHTAGGHRADLQIGYWSTDNLGKVATAYVIGSKSTRDGNQDYDGKIYRAFDDRYWGYHLGLKNSNNVPFNKKSVGIEVCNYGLVKFVDGKYITYVHSEIPKTDVYKMPVKFKGYEYAHKYTDAQIKALKELILQIANAHGINVKKKWDPASFAADKNAFIGVPGIFTHCQIREDKFDMHPQPELIDMLNSL